MAEKEIAESASANHVLRWSKPVLSLAELRPSLNGHREIVVPPRAIVTPLALEELRASGISVRRETGTPQTEAKSVLGLAQERPFPMVRSAVQALEREGQRFQELRTNAPAGECRWAQELANCVARGECTGGVIFCGDGGLVCCVANKVAGLRAVPIISVAQAGRAILTLGANLLAVEMPGRTYFEVRQILRILAGKPQCPPGVACTLEELDGHAHR